MGGVAQKHSGGSTRILLLISLRNFPHESGSTSCAMKCSPAHETPARDVGGRTLVKALCHDWDYHVVNQEGSHIILSDRLAISSAHIGARS